MTASKEELKSVHIDEVLSNFHIFSRYHVKSMFLFFLAFTVHCMFVNNYVFAVKQVDYRCKSGLDVCSKRYSYNSSIIDTCNTNLNSDDDYKTICTNISDSVAVCSDPEYDDDTSFVAEFDLTCEEWKRTLVGSVHNFGLMIGLLLIGPISDRFGRKASIVIPGIIGGTLGLVKSYVHNYWLYIVIEFMEAAFGDVCSPTYMLTIETVFAKDRVLFLTIAHFGIQAGGILGACLAWSFPYWRDFVRVTYGPTLLLFIFYIFAIDESPRWLMTKNKKDAAVAVLKKAAKINRITLDKNFVDNLTNDKGTEKEQDVKSVLKMTLKSKVLFGRLMVSFLWWVTSILVCYGVTINSVLLKGNEYLNYILLSLIDIPSVVVTGYILSRFRRKKPLILCFLAAAVFFFIQPLIPDEYTWLSMMFYLAGRFSASTYLGIIYIYTSELFPTHSRNTLHAMCSSVGRVGSILAPQTPLLMVYWAGIPALIYSGLSLVSGLATVFVADIEHDALPDTVEQAENIGKKVRKIEKVTDKC
ncbi:hypothetical protein JYU34_010595 [Plutella xylostella]|uniref:Major facilitator superfamily (MFS) profile domain-containing protein n=1 Tax=Plutella xylostella TaxID=51655 RepID=A0ABQ7QIR2_PLUXY|nr:hypothetical protein JYU34_010595 [Plutella xylostella]